MDITTYALAKKYTDSKVIQVSEGIVPQIGENGNWIIAGVDSGIKASSEQVEVDGTGKLKVDSTNGNLLIVDEDGHTIATITGQQEISDNNIDALFEDD